MTSELDDPRGTMSVRDATRAVSDHAQIGMAVLDSASASALAALAADGTSLRIDLKLGAPDDTERWVQPHLSRAPDDDAGRSPIVGAFEEVTDERKAADHARATARRMEQLVEQANEVYTANVTLDDPRVRHHPPLAPGPYAMVAVIDTGDGIDAQTRAHLFEPFFTTKEEGKGAGMGLASAYGIIKQSGGFIEVASELGCDSTFTFYLPSTDTPASPDDERTARATRL